MAKRHSSTDISKMSFEAALEELESIVRQLEDGKVSLDDAIAAYERGAALKQHCESKLAQAQEKVSKIKLGADGAPTAETTDADKDEIPF